VSGQSLGSAPIFCAHLLRRVDEKLVDLLGSLEPSEWDLQTLAPLWKVRDVAAHLLDTVLRKLSMVRDSCYVEAVTIRSPQDVIDLVNRLNAEGVTVYRRLSPPVLIDMMKAACQQSASFHESLDPFAPATFAVSWAGEETSLNWFDTARELTERWHHQQQIRLATNRPGIMTPDLYHPVLDCSCGDCRTFIEMLMRPSEQCSCWRFPANAAGNGFCPENRHDGIFWADRPGSSPAVSRYRRSWLGVFLQRASIVIPPGRRLRSKEIETLAKGFFI
jgi:uncharacterized protein (TIGR03083 family)